MNSIVLDLQQKALDKNADVADLVRITLAVASKLRLDDLRLWAERELNGYTEDGVTLPTYRIFDAETKADNPSLGLVPLHIHDPGLAREAMKANCNDSVGKLQHIINHEKVGGVLQQPYSPEYRNMLMEHMDGEPFVPTRVISMASLAGVLDAIRNIILSWSLRLEENGILGEGMTFSAAEKKAATESSIHIANFHGVLGNVQAEQVQIGNYNSIREELKKVGIPQDARNELENILDEFKTATSDKKKPLAKRGLDWVVQHADSLGKLAGVIRGLFGG